MKHYNASLGPPPRTVLCHGTFDLLHLGHIRHLQEAAAMGERLVVSVTSDRYVGKGIGRPHFTEVQRCEALRALECVDEVILSDHPDATSVIAAIRPAVYVKGIDYRDHHGNPGLKREREAVEKSGGKIAFTTSDKWSSSRLLNAGRFTDDVLQYLDHARRSGVRDRILAAFDAADKKLVAFVGETIIDEYQYVQGLGRASKEMMLATVRTGAESFFGGVVAASNHGDWPQHAVVTVPQTITKTRLVEKDFNRKLFDVYSAREIVLEDEDRDEFRAVLEDVVRTASVVVVMDFGHGLIGPMERTILGRAPFLAVNSQTNAGNYGFNPVTNFKRAGFVCVDDPEARLATQMKDAPIEHVVDALTERIRPVPSVSGCTNFLVTRGRHGSIYRSATERGKSPAFLSNGVDTMGAGDAVIAVTAPLIAAGLGLADAALVGNVAGGIKTTIVGHRRHVERNELVQTIEALLA